MEYLDYCAIPNRGIPLRSLPLRAIPCTVTEVPIEEPEEPSGGGKIYREKLATSQKHEGQWRKRLDREDEELLAMVVAITETL